MSLTCARPQQGNGNKESVFCQTSAVFAYTSAVVCTFGERLSWLLDPITYQGRAAGGENWVFKGTAYRYVGTQKNVHGHRRQWCKWRSWSQCRALEIALKIFFIKIFLRWLFIYFFKYLLLYLINVLFRNRIGKKIWRIWLIHCCCREGLCNNFSDLFAFYSFCPFYL